MYALAAKKTKNVWDETFGHIKRRLGHTDYLSFQEIMSIIDKRQHRSFPTFKFIGGTGKSGWINIFGSLPH